MFSRCFLIRTLCFLLVCEQMQLSAVSRRFIHLPRPSSLSRPTLLLIMLLCHTVDQAVTDLGLDPDAEFDFLDTIHIMGKLAGEDTVVAPDKTMASPGDGEDSHHHHHKHHHHHQHHHRKTRRSIMGRRLSTSSSSDPSGRESDHSSTVCTVS